LTAPMFVSFTAALFSNMEKQIHVLLRMM